MCARRISNGLCEEWELKRTLQDMEAPEQSLAFFLDSETMLKYVYFAHKGKSNTYALAVSS